ncbi:MAG: hypothetical protein WKF84_14355 [Pyrinomonadaceae bacterium]
MPQVAIDIFGAGISFGQPDFLDRIAYPDERRIQFADSVTLTAGNQTIKFGGDFNRVRDKLDNLFLGGGGYTYNNAYRFS